MSAKNVADLMEFKESLVGKNRKDGVTATNAMNPTVMAVAMLAGTACMETDYSLLVTAMLMRLERPISQATTGIH